MKLLNKLIAAGVLIGTGALLYKNKDKIQSNFKKYQLKNKLNLKVLEEARQEYYDVLAAQNELKETLKDKFELVDKFEKLQSEYIDIQKRVLNNEEELTEEMHNKIELINENMQQMYEEYNDACTVLKKHEDELDFLDKQVVDAKQTYDKARKCVCSFYINTKPVIDKVNDSISFMGDKLDSLKKQHLNNQCSDECLEETEEESKKTDYIENLKNNTEDLYNKAINKTQETINNLKDTIHKHE